MKCPYFEECWPHTHKNPRGMALTCIDTTQESIEQCGWYKEFLQVATKKEEK